MRRHSDGRKLMNRVRDDTSASLLEAAHRLLYSDGPDALTIRRIANEAGMSTMNVYSRFGGKDGVIDEIYADGHRRLGRALSAIPVTDDVFADLMNVADEYRTFAKAYSAYYGVMFRSTVPGFQPRDDTRTEALLALGSLVERIRQGQRNDSIDPEHDAETVAAWLWGTCHGLVSFELDNAGGTAVSWSDVWEMGLRTSIQSLRHVSADTPTGV
jgi:AcrR family transcriptional regulator